MTHEQLTALNNVLTMYPRNTDNKVALDETVSSKFTWQVKDDRMGDYYVAYEGTLWECIALQQAYNEEPANSF